jgi:hypothetical protein
MERGKHLFPSRTQQLSLSSVTILGFNPGKIARCRIIEKPSERVAFLFFGRNYTLLVKYWRSIIITLRRFDMNKPVDETPVTLNEESFLDVIEKELSKRGSSGGGKGQDNDGRGKPDRPDGPNLIGALIIGAVAALTLAILSKSKPKTKKG